MRRFENEGYEIKRQKYFTVLRDNWDDEDAVQMCPLFETIV